MMTIYYVRTLYMHLALFLHDALCLCLHAHTRTHTHTLSRAHTHTLSRMHTHTHTHIAPARINHSVPLPPSTQTNMHIGAGRPQQSVEITAGNTATLYCPATGIGAPTTSWWRIRYNSLGEPVEEPLTSSRCLYVCCVC